MKDVPKEVRQSFVSLGEGDSSPIAEESPRLKSEKNNIQSSPRITKRSTTYFSKENASAIMAQTEKGPLKKDRSFG